MLEHEPKWNRGKWQRGCNNNKVKVGHHMAEFIPNRKIIAAQKHHIFYPFLMAISMFLSSSVGFNLFSPDLASFFTLSLLYPTLFSLFALPIQFSQIWRRSLVPFFLSLLDTDARAPLKSENVECKHHRWWQMAIWLIKVKK